MKKTYIVRAGYWLIIILAVVEIWVLIVSFYPLVLHGYEQYKITVGLVKTLWSLFPAFTFLNGIFLASLAIIWSRSGLKRK